MAAPGGGVLPDPAVRDSRVQPEEERDRHPLLHARQLQLGDPQRRFLAHDQDLVPARDRDDRDQPASLRADDLLGASESAEAPAGDRVLRADPVHRSADRHGRRAPAHVQLDTALVLCRALGVPRHGVRDPCFPVHVLLPGRRLPLDRRPHADGGVAEPRRELAHDALPRHPPEHPLGGARGIDPDPRNRARRVHDREPRGVPHVPDFPAVRQRVAGFPRRRVDAPLVRHHVGGDALAAPRRTETRRPRRRDHGGPLMTYLQLENLHSDFGTVKALNGIDISLGEGEFLSMLGPSGCGKTTALRLVAGFDRPDAGRILVDGKDVTGVPPNKRDMGMVFQAYSLFPNMTAQQNVEFGLKIRGRDKSDRSKRVGDLLELVGLGQAVSRYPHQLSGGMQQRVALARALAIEPRVLLLDEPLSALDAKVRVQLREEIRRIQLELGITTLYVTHDQEEALAISDHVAVMYGGRIEQMGTPSQMYTAPLTPFVAEFIGTMNRLEATVVDGTRGDVDYGGNRLRIDAARGRPQGERVLLLIRPESLELEAPTNGASPNGNTLHGEVITQTFLGPVTRLKVSGPSTSLIADMSTARAAALPVGATVVARIPAEGAKLLTLPPEGVPPIEGVDPDDQ